MSLYVTRQFSQMFPCFPICNPFFEDVPLLCFNTFEGSLYRQTLCRQSGQHLHLQRQTHLCRTVGRMPLGAIEMCIV